MLAPPKEEKAATLMWTDHISYSIQRQDFEAKTLRVLKLARAGLVYLSLSMHREECRRAKGKCDARTVTVRLDLWQDDWKQ